MAELNEIEELNDNNPYIDRTEWIQIQILEELEKRDNEKKKLSNSLIEFFNRIF